MQSRFYCPSFAYCRFSLRDAGRGRPFRSLPQAGACTPLGNNLSPVCSQCRRRFRFIAAVPLPPGMPEGIAAPSVFFRRQGHVPRQETICLPSAVNAVGASDLPPPFLFLRGCRKGPPPLPLSSAGGGAYPAEERFSVRQDATTCCPLLFHPFRKPLPKENRFRFIKVRVRQYRARTFMLLAKEDVSSLANFLTRENLPPTRSAAASPSTGSWSPRRFPTHNAHRDRSAPRTSCTSRPTAQPSPRQW